MLFKLLQAFHAKAFLVLMSASVLCIHAPRYLKSLTSFKLLPSWVLICTSCGWLGRSIQLVHTQVLGKRCGVLMDFLPILYLQVCAWVHCVPSPYLWVLQDFDGRRVSCQAWRQGKWFWAESLNALCRCVHRAHVSLPCCSGERLLRLSYPQSVSVATTSGIGPRCSCPGLGWFQSSFIPGWPLGWLGHWRSHTSWR